MDTPRLDIGFTDIKTAEAVARKYREIYPDDDFLPEVVEGNSERGWPAIIKVPQDKYIKFDMALWVVLRG